MCRLETLLMHQSARGDRVHVLDARAGPELSRQGATAHPHVGGTHPHRVATNPSHGDAIDERQAALRPAVAVEQRRETALQTLADTLRRRSLRNHLRRFTATAQTRRCSA